MEIPDERRETQVRSLLSQAAERLRTCLSGAPAGFADTPYLDAVALLCHVMAKEKEALFARLTDDVGADVAQSFSDAVTRRCNGEPIGYIRGYKEFYGREFSVSPAVLIPRPDSEVLVEAALGEIDRLAAAGDRDISLHDCCTGSGCIAITVAAERTNVTVTASDVSDATLGVARQNSAVVLGAELAMFVSEGLSATRNQVGSFTSDKIDIVTANPPYLADSEVEALLTSGWPEPRAALAGGTTGMAIIDDIVTRAPEVLKPRGALLIEHGADQGPAVQCLLRDAGFVEVHGIQDLGGRDRVSVGRMSKTAGPGSPVA